MSDPFADSVVLHLPLDAVIPLTVLPPDASPWRNQITAYGSISISAARSKFGVASAYFPGSGSSYYTAGDGSAQSIANLSPTPPYTMEGWFLFDNVATQKLATMWANNSDGLQFVTTSAGELSLIEGITSSFRTTTGVTTLVTGRWYHLAAVDTGSTVYLFVDGAIDAQAAVSGTVKTGTQPRLYIGRDSQSSDIFRGCMNDFRLTKAARYTSAFTPPDAIPYTLPSLTAAVLDKLSAPSAFSPPESRGGYLKGVAGYRDIYDGGGGKIVGTVKEKHSPANLPLARRVRLHKTRDGRPLAETWSTAAGDYSFKYLDPMGNYYVVGFDHLGNYRGVIADNLTPEAM